MNTREENVAYFAQKIREGLGERSHGYLWQDPEGTRHDITAEVLAAAGEETPEETTARLIAREHFLPERLADRLQEECYEELEHGGVWLQGDRFEPIADDDSPDELVYRRRSDGKKFLVEVFVEVRPEY